jgi:hypothetical protein
MPIDPMKVNPNSRVAKKSILARNAFRAKKKVNFADAKREKKFEKYTEDNRQHAKAITMKIRLNSIRDRWLMNIRPFDYEIYVASSFMLIRTKEEIEFLRETGMNKLGVKDANNLLHFLE